MPQLTRLEVLDCILLSDNDSEALGEQTQNGATAFLYAVGRLHRLRHLQVHGTNDIRTTLSAAQPQQCAALTASYHLTHLEVLLCEVIDALNPLPDGAPQHMFPEGKEYPQLQVVKLAVYYCCYAEMQSLMSTADLGSIIRACPALSSLDISAALQPQADLSPLLQLPPTCCDLTVGGEAFGDNAAPVVAQLTCLTSLSWVGWKGLTDAGLDQLTVLTQLQRLCLAIDNSRCCSILDPVPDLCGGFVKRLELTSSKDEAPSQVSLAG